MTFGDRMGVDEDPSESAYPIHLGHSRPTLTCSHERPADSEEISAADNAAQAADSADYFSNRGGHQALVTFGDRMGVDEDPSESAYPIHLGHSRPTLTCSHERPADSEEISAADNAAQAADSADYFSNRGGHQALVTFGDRMGVDEDLRREPALSASSTADSSGSSAAHVDVFTRGFP